MNIRGVAWQPFLVAGHDYLLITCILICITIFCILLPCTRRASRVKVIGAIYIYIYVCGRKKYLNRTFVIDSPFLTFAVGLLVEFID